METEIKPFADFKAQHTQEHAAHQAYAEHLYKHGQFKQAIPHFIDSFNLKKELSTEISVDQYNIAAANFYALGDYRSAIIFSELALKILPNNIKILTNLGIMYNKLNEDKKAQGFLSQALKVDKQDFNLLSTLTSLAHKQKEFKRVKKYGRQSLKLKDKYVCAKVHLDQLKKYIDLNKYKHFSKPQFKPDCKTKNIIAYSLWGNDKKYTFPAVLNIYVAACLYPEWTCRIYYDESVPEDVIKQLQETGAQLYKMPKARLAYEGLFWRFGVINDPEIDFFLIRDCDSMLTCQEKIAVDEWLASDKAFHIMRNNPTHTELILAGMWGGVANQLPDLQPLYQRYIENNEIERTIDQRFLREYVWPLIKNNNYTHDDVFTFHKAHSFFKIGHLPSGKFHVGQGWVTVKQS